MSRWKASGIHLLLSAAIAVGLVALMLSIWYPGPLFEAAGGDRLIFILVAVDVTLGPLITLVIFKAGKPGLKFDLAFIAAVQLAALAYGMHTVYLARPVYLVFTKDRFDLVSAKDLDPQDLQKAARPEFERLPLGRPRYIAAVSPTDFEARQKLLMESLQGKDLQMHPQYYVPYEQEIPAALARAQPVAVLIKRYPGTIEQHLRSAGRSQESVKFLPLRGKETDGAVLLDARTGAPLDIVLVDPW
ncbi:MAG TPA: TfpX/TfpZ family type IV pilin accessory protein [Burkholderiales bacterium]|jgi:hypothetical protein